MLRYASAFVFGLASLVTVNQAEAGSNVFDPTPLVACNTLNCSSERISGTVVSFGNNVRVALLPWTLRIFTPANTCLRAEIVSQAVDLEMVLAAPNGTAFRDDDGGVGARPLIKVNGTGNLGYSTLQVSTFNGVAPGGNFILLYGVYPLNNINCAAPTQPRSVFDRSRKTNEGGDFFENFDTFDPEATPSVE